MKSKFLAGVAAIALAPASAMAVGLDRSNSDINVLFEDGNYFELSFGRVFPDVSGTDGAINPPIGTPGGFNSGDVAEDFTQIGAGLKLQLSEKLSMAFISGEPFGADVSYPTFAAGGSANLGGTSAQLDSSELMALARYKINDNFSVHGGLRYVRLGDAEVTLSGAAYGGPVNAPAPNTGLNGYNVQFGDDADLGYAIGAAYERPEIALRVALTYFSKTEHDLPTNETIPGTPIRADTADTRVETPDSINLDFQTGLNQKTLLFGQIRYAWYEDVILRPQAYSVATPNSLTDIDNNYSLQIGVGRRLTDKLSGSVTFGYEPKGDDDFVSALAPTNGQKSIGIGLSYDVTDQLTVAGGVRYVKLGDARPDSGACGIPALAPGGCGTFENNDVIGVGLQVGYSF
ncbi:Outer membrane protein transport protein (OMPP1/FadL/TodX) [Rhodobacteraceae bacterium THAF1]|uniref:OmpP1/FadL family transporter n=1 Tax=Palleronia sp. THAF1 TaxID=2587842 RepID=UPI000F3BF7D3|nr:outer membrane protein transport protein [Palleronia sp. THAF1]QFU08973.1 Outer membrane protein transport protein (OMPP1/FadL/TodX) [Palleronia sp. THAF1]VDC24288.1 Outer membrane protein transport protein (OMPP1/FadL/TodX) [Rhodobacteraceae bacterium THAF1]